MLRQTRFTFRMRGPVSAVPMVVDWNHLNLFPNTYIYFRMTLIHRLLYYYYHRRIRVFLCFFEPLFLFCFVLFFSLMHVNICFRVNGAIKSVKRKYCRLSSQPNHLRSMVILHARVCTESSLDGTI